MAYTATKVKVRKVGPLPDRPGAIAEKLALAAANGVGLAAGIAYSSKPGESCNAYVVLANEAAHGHLADQEGYPPDPESPAIMVTGDDAPGVGAEVTRKIAAVGVSLRVFCGLSFAGKFGLLLGFDTEADADKALAALA